MLKKTILTTLFLLTTSCNIAIADPTQLVPCEELFKLVPVSDKYFSHLFNHYGTKGNLEKLKPVFTMYIVPSFEPESAIVVYKSEQNYFIEQLSTTESIWYSLHNQSEQKYQGFEYAPKDAKFNLPPIISQSVKKISHQTATKLEKAALHAVKNSRFVLSELKDSGQLDGTSIYFVSSDNQCSRIWGFSKTGIVGSMDILSETLVKYLAGTSNEDSIYSASEKVLNN